MIIIVSYTNKLIILVVYKKTYFIFNDLYHVVPNMVVSLLQEFADIFFKYILNELPPVRRVIVD